MPGTARKSRAAGAECAPGTARKLCAAGAERSPGTAWKSRAAGAERASVTARKFRAACEFCAADTPGTPNEPGSADAQPHPQLVSEPAAENGQLAGTAAGAACAAETAHVPGEKGQTHGVLAEDRGRTAGSAAALLHRQRCGEIPPRRDCPGCGSLRHSQRGYPKGHHPAAG